MDWNGSNILKISIYVSIDLMKQVIVLICIENTSIVIECIKSSAD